MIANAILATVAAVVVSSLSAFLLILAVSTIGEDPPIV